MQQMFLLQILLLAQNVSGTIMPIIRSSAAAARKPDTQLSAPNYADNLKTKAPNTTGSNQLYNTLELLMMGTMVPETCWASNKICNKKHLLHLVGILFPHINEDARSESLQIYRFIKFVKFSTSRTLVKEESCNRPGVAQRAAGSLGSQISMTFGTWRWWGCQRHAPAAFTHRRYSLVLIFTRGWVDPRAMGH